MLGDLALARKGDKLVIFYCNGPECTMSRKACKGAAAAGYTNIHEHIPFRTLTGRAHFYQDHEWMLDFGEGFCAYRGPLDWDDLAAYFAARAIPGVESVEGDTYRRTIVVRGHPGAGGGRVDLRNHRVRGFHHLFHGLRHQGPPGCRRDGLARI